MTERQFTRGTLAFRRATDNDAARLWCWRNEESARAASVQTAPVRFLSHIEWFEAVQADPNEQLYVVRDTARDVWAGSCRLSFCGRTVSISLVVDVAQRGRGYASQMIAALVEQLVARPSDVEMAVAFVKEDNEASVRAFWQLGFRPSDAPAARENDGLLTLTYALPVARTEGAQTDGVDDAGGDAAGHTAAGSGAPGGDDGDHGPAKRRRRRPAPQPAPAGEA